MTKCRNCGAEVEQDFEYCPECGAELRAQRNEGQANGSTPPYDAATKWVAGILVVASAVFFVVNYVGNGSNGEEAISEGSSSSSNVELPSYRVKNTTELVRGPTLGAIIIPEYDGGIDTTKMRRVGQAILEREGLDEGGFYNSTLAEEAAYNKDIYDQNPCAYEEGMLGRWEKGEFHPNPYVHDDRFGFTDGCGVEYRGE